ncbi:transposase, partial [Desulfobacter sp.]|uniref:transposase n=1 Tax=Desulfobacter sp. TaxID=2294 RepID=UPI003D133049
MNSLTQFTIGGQRIQVNIKTLIDDAQCYDTVRELRWPEGCQCPHCDSKRLIKRGFEEKEPA